MGHRVEATLPRSPLIVADSGVGTLAWIQRIVWAAAAVALLLWLAARVVSSLQPAQTFLGWTSIVLVVVGGLLRLATWNAGRRS